MIKLIMGVLNVIPILDKWFQQIAVEYAKMQREKNNVEFTKAIEKATVSKDVTDLRSSIGDKLD